MSSSTLAKGPATWPRATCPVRAATPTPEWGRIFSGLPQTHSRDATKQALALR